MRKPIEPSEIIRRNLNKLPEKDMNGNYNRFGNQFITWFFGGMAESSNDQRVRKLGSILRRGAEKSFADYVGQKVSEEITKLFRNDYYY